MAGRDSRKQSARPISIAFIGGGSQSWAPTIVRDIIFKQGLDKTGLEIRLWDLDMPRAKAIESLFTAMLKTWKVEYAIVKACKSKEEALTNVDFVIIAISTGRLPAMKHDLAIPEKYGVYHTVGDTAGPGGWSRALRNIPVFQQYAEDIKSLSSNAFVLNYTNPMTPLTMVLSRTLGWGKVVGLCHGLFESREELMQIFELKDEKELHLTFGGVNHFFWVLDFKVRGQPGYPMLREKIGSGTYQDLVKSTTPDAMGFTSNRLLASELFAQFGYLPYVGDRHTSEFVTPFITNKEVMERYKIVRTTIDEREGWYKAAEKKIKTWTEGRKFEGKALSKKPSRETAADIIKAIAFNEGFSDVVNTVNVGQIDNLPHGSVVETPGYIDGSGIVPLTVGPLPEPIRAVCAPHAAVQIEIVESTLSGDIDRALQALMADPCCAHLTPSEVRKMGLELIEAHCKYLPQFFGGK